MCHYQGNKRGNSEQYFYQAGAIPIILLLIILHFVLVFGRVGGLAPPPSMLCRGLGPDYDKSMFTQCKCFSPLYLHPAGLLAGVTRCCFIVLCLLLACCRWKNTHPVYPLCHHANMVPADIHHQGAAVSCAPRADNGGSYPTICCCW